MTTLKEQSETVSTTDGSCICDTCVRKQHIKYGTRCLEGLTQFQNRTQCSKYRGFHEYKNLKEQHEADMAATGGKAIELGWWESMSNHPVKQWNGWKKIPIGFVPDFDSVNVKHRRSPTAPDLEEWQNNRFKQIKKDIEYIERKRCEMGGCIHGVVGFCQWCNEDAKERIKKLNLPKIDIRALYPDSLPQQGPIEEEPEQDKCACESCLEEITIDDLVSWADGVMGALGTEYAQRVTDLEIEIAYLILFAVKKNKQNKQNKIRIYGAWYDEEGNIVACFC